MVDLVLHEIYSLPKDITLVLGTHTHKSKIDGPTCKEAWAIKGGRQ